MQSDWTELVFKAAIFVLVVLFYKVLVPVAKQWVQNNMDERVQTIVKDAVLAANQTIADNPDKKAWVVQNVTKKLMSLGINFTASELDTWIEACVYSVKNYL